MTINVSVHETYHVQELQRRLMKPRMDPSWDSRAALRMKALGEPKRRRCADTNKCMHFTSIRYCEEPAGNEADSSLQCPTLLRGRALVFKVTGNCYQYC